MTRPRSALLLLAPTLIIVLGTALYPLGFSLLTSVRDWRLMDSPLPGGFVGLENYAAALDDPDFWASVRTTAAFVAMDVLATTLAALGLALLLRGPGRAKAAVRVMLILPFAMNPALIGIFWRFMLNPEFGVFEYALDAVMPSQRSVSWLADPVLSMASLISADLWHWSPYFAFMLMGALAGVPPETLEAARIDGAGEARVFRLVTLPQIAPVLAVVVVLKTVFALKAFDMIVTMTGGGPGRATTTLAYFAYQVGFRDYDMGYAAAVSYILTALLVAFSLIYMRLLFRQEAT